MRVEQHLAKGGSRKAIQKSSKKRTVRGLEKVFRNICVVLFMILVFCIPGFLKFRQHCEDKGYGVIAEEAFVWCIVGFCVIFAFKFGYFALMEKPIQKLLNPSYDEETKSKKIKLLLKLSYDTLFYSACTIVAYLAFQDQYWFPKVIGGCGACSDLYKQYPDWPQQKKVELERYFCFQLGVHIFSVFQLVVFKRKDHKYYEWMLHHFMATSLILFSLLSNQVIPGLLVLIVHDASDIFMAGGRFYSECFIKKKPAVTAFFFFMLFATWIHLRLLVFPLCLLSSVYNNRPLPTDQWYMIQWEYFYLLSMAFVLFGMHLYWTYCLIKSAHASLKKDKCTNQFDQDKKKL